MELITVSVVLLTLVVLYYAQNLLDLWKYFKLVEKIPTKKPNPIFGHALYLLVPRNCLLERFMQMVKDNEPICTIWMGPYPFLLLSDPKDVEVILGSAKYINKSFPYTFFKSWLGNGLLTSNDFKWHSHRKLLTPSFHFTILENFVQIFSENSIKLVKKLEREIGSETFDIYPYITTCALDIICETSMGTQINAQDQEEHSEYVNAVLKITTELMQRTLSPWLYPDFIYNLTPSRRRLMNYVKIMHNFANQVIQERKQYRIKKSFQKTEDDDTVLGKKKRLNFLDLLLESSESGSNLTDEEIREEVDTFMFEGHDTTTTGISWALQMLALHPNIQDNVYEELESIFQGSDRSPTTKDLNDMKYLERVIKETLRLYPSVPAIARELTEDVEINGCTIPAGIRILFLIVCMHRNEEYFPDPLKFNPDNFLPDRVAGRHPYAYIPFSAGPRNCIGQKFALLEEKTIISYILRHYKLEATTVAPIPLPDLILRPENGIRLKIKPRQTRF